MSAVYKGRDNVIEAIVYDGSEVADLSQMNRVAAEVGDVTVDSLSYPDAFDWSALNGSIRMKLGLSQDIIPGIQSARIIGYSPLWPNGIVFGSLSITIFD